MDHLFLICVLVTALNRLAESLTTLLREWRKIDQSDGTQRNE